MKQTYINPELQVVEIQTRLLLTLSDPNSEVKLSTTDTTDSMDARESDFDWEDEE